MTKRKRRLLIGEIVAVILTMIIFIIPFYFMFVQSIKTKEEANLLTINWPTQGIHLVENYAKVFSNANYQLVTAFKNSLLLTLFTVIGLIITGSMAGYVIQRRRDRLMQAVQWVIMLGLMIPAAILPTISLLQKLHIYKTMFGMVMIEIALQTPFTIMLFRGYMASIPTELEESARIDGCSRFQIFTKIISPLLKPIRLFAEALHLVGRNDLLRLVGGLRHLHREGDLSSRPNRPCKQRTRSYYENKQCLLHFTISCQKGMSAEDDDGPLVDRKPIGGGRGTVAGLRSGTPGGGNRPFGRVGQ